MQDSYRHVVRFSAIGAWVLGLVLVAHGAVQSSPGWEIEWISPRPGAFFRVGSKVTIAWKSVAATSSSEGVFVQVREGEAEEWRSIASGHSSSGSTVWRPEVAINNVRLRLVGSNGKALASGITIHIRPALIQWAPTTVSSLSVMSDGSLRYWGRQPDEFGAEGVDGNPYYTRRPVRVFSWMDDVKEVSSGFDHSVLLRGDGSVWIWGTGHWYHDGGVIREPLPIAEVGAARWVSAGISNTFIMDVEGQVWGFGGNGWGSLGDGSNEPRRVPVRLPQLDGCGKIVASDLHSLAVCADGSVLAWGLNGTGQLGDGSTESRFDPGVVPGLGDVVEVAAKGRFSVALKRDGTVWTWGLNDRGQLGIGSLERVVATPQRVPGLDDIVQVASGHNSGYALRSDGRLFSWGLNSKGQLGVGGKRDRILPDSIRGRRFQEVWSGYAVLV